MKWHRNNRHLYSAVHNRMNSKNNFLSFKCLTKTVTVTATLTSTMPAITVAMPMPHSVPIKRFSTKSGAGNDGHDDDGNDDGKKSSKKVLKEDKEEEEGQEEEVKSSSTTKDDLKKSSAISPPASGKKSVASGGSGLRGKLLGGGRMAPKRNGSLTKFTPNSSGMISSNQSQPQVPLECTLLRTQANMPSLRGERSAKLTNVIYK